VLAIVLVLVHPEVLIHNKIRARLLSCQKATWYFLISTVSFQPMLESVSQYILIEFYFVRQVHGLRSGKDLHFKKMIWIPVSRGILFVIYAVFDTRWNEQVTMYVWSRCVDLKSCILLALLIRI
jgi:hypothetical protein